jgi:hypothetical protein
LTISDGEHALKKMGDPNTIVRILKMMPTASQYAAKKVSDSPTYG